MVAEQAGEGSRALLQIAKIGIRKGRTRMVASFATIDGNQAGGVAHARDGIEESGADPGEDGAVGGDSEGKGEHGHESEAGRLGEDAEGVTDIVNQRADFRVDRAG